MTANTTMSLNCLLYSLPTVAIASSYRSSGFRQERQVLTLGFDLNIRETLAHLILCAIDALYEVRYIVQ